ARWHRSPSCRGCSSSPGCGSSGDRDHVPEPFAAAGPAVTLGRGEGGARSEETGTSLAMIEKHYGKYVPAAADILTTCSSSMRRRERFPKIRAPDGLGRAVSSRRAPC